MKEKKTLSTNCLKYIYTYKYSFEPLKNFAASWFISKVFGNKRTGPKHFILLLGVFF